MKTQVIWSLLVLAVVAGGCAHNPDPFFRPNRQIESFNMALDKAVVHDIAAGYTKHVPKPVRQGFGNFFDNLAYFNVIANDYLQGRFAQGWRDSERMAVNSTVGILGVFDPATGMGLPREHNDFGITLGRWGVGPGPYLMVPLLGPSTARDLPSLLVARVTTPIFYLDPPLAFTLPLDVVSFTDQRASLQPAIDVRDRAALDPYTFTRDVYLRYRAAKIGGTSADVYDKDPDEFYDDDDDDAPPMKGPGATNYIR